MQALTRSREVPSAPQERDARVVPKATTHGYRADVDGLRAVAILAVVLFHAGFGFRGGYVGVDVFFVISGFLITGLVWKDLENDRFTFAHFWERRARRIVPALVAITLATLVAGWFFLLPAEYVDLGKAAASQALFGANVYYWRATGYFAGAADEKPLLHTWSLAVEEQFYLVVPLLLWGLYRLSRRSRRALLAAALVGFGLSLTLSVYGVAHFRSAAFYLLPTRAWELALGSIVALLPTAVRPPSTRVAREAIAVAGTALVAIPIAFYTSATPFPGLAALLPCLGTALLIWVNRPEEGRPTTAVGALLSTRPMVGVGLISYSLYLWHWPVLAFARYLALEPLSVWLRVMLVACGTLLGVLSWRYVETPFRERRLGASRRSVFAYATVGLALVLVGGALTVVADGFPDRLPPEAQQYAKAAEDPPIPWQMTAESVAADRLVAIGVDDPTAEPTVLIWGDSHAGAAMPAVDALLKERGLAGRAAIHSATAPVLDWYKTLDFGLGADSVGFNAAVLAYVERHHVRDVILVARWQGYMDEKGTDAGGGVALEDALLATVGRLVAAGSHPWIMLQVPEQSFDVPKALSRPIYSADYIDSILAKPAARSELEKNRPGFIAEIEAAGGQVLDPKPRFLDPTGQRYVVQRDGVALYRDKHHLTPDGCRLVLLPFLRDAFAPSSILLK